MAHPDFYGWHDEVWAAHAASGQIEDPVLDLAYESWANGMDANTFLKTVGSEPPSSESGLLSVAEKRLFSLPRLWSISRADHIQLRDHAADCVAKVIVGRLGTRPTWTAADPKDFPRCHKFSSATMELLGQPVTVWGMVKNRASSPTETSPRYAHNTTIIALAETWGFRLDGITAKKQCGCFFGNRDTLNQSIVMWSLYDTGVC